MKIKHIITPKEKDLGEFSVRRALPSAKQPMVGPWIFFDHMGPAEFPAGSGINVRPHPHVNLATVTYLFEGEILHRDSLGSLQPIRPGDINLMVAVGDSLAVPTAQQLAVYVASGSIRIDGEVVPQHSMAVLEDDPNGTIEAMADSRVALIGGKGAFPRCRVTRKSLFRCLKFERESY